MHDISPIVENLETINKELDRPPNQVDMFKEVMNQGNELIRMGAKIKKSWNPFKKYMYSKKLHDFQETLILFCQIQVPTEQLRSTRSISKDVRDLIELVKKEMNHISEKIDSMQRTGSSNAISTSSNYSGYSGLAELPELIVGLNLPLDELKVMLLNDNVFGTQQPVVVVLSAPPGCGKTILANMVCHDSEIKGINYSLSVILYLAY